MEDIIVISEGNEVTYAKQFKDLFITYVEDNTIMSLKGKINKIELYSKQVYFNSNIAKKSVKWIVGDVMVDTPPLKPLYEDLGVSCYAGDHFIKFLVDSKKAIMNYDSIFHKLEKIEEEYFHNESEYVKLSGRKKMIYINKNNSLFSKKWISERIKQAYAYLAYYYYIYEMP